MDILRLKRRTVSEENGEIISYLKYTSENFGGGDKFTSENLRSESPLDIAARLEEMADQIMDQVPPDANPIDLQKQVKRLREEAFALRSGGVNIFED